MFYLSLFLLFVYFKIARIHKKEEKMNALVLVQHIVTFVAASSIFVYGFIHLAWYFVVIFSFLFFIIAALIITTVQLGIFIDGKPQFGISQVYKYMPFLTLGIVLLSVILWL